MRVIGVVLVAVVLLTACGAGAAGPAATSTGVPATGAATTAPSAAAAQRAMPAATAQGGGTLALGERRSDGGGVGVVAEWSSPEPPSLKLTLDTHSVDLDRFDLSRVMKLRLDGGDWTAPTAADVPKGGHHRAGTVTFGSVTPAAFASARLIELRVVEVATPERLLRWERG